MLFVYISSEKNKDKIEGATEFLLLIEGKLNEISENKSC